MRGNVVAPRRRAMGGAYARWPSIGQCDSLKCLLPDNWSGNSAAAALLLQCSMAVDGRRDGRCDHDCCGLPQAHRGLVARTERSGKSRSRVPGIVEKSYRANEFIFMRGDPFDYWTGIVTGLARMGTVSSGGKAASFGRPDRGRLVRRGLRAQERAAPLRRGRVARYAAGADGPQHLLLVVREQRRVQPLPGPAAQRAARPVHRAAGTWPHARCHRPRRALRSPRCSIPFSIRT